MTTFVEKLVAEIVVSLCVGTVLGLISGLLPASDENVRQNRRLVCGSCGSDAMTEAEPDQVPPGDEQQ
jgi:hypothetical protein